MHRPGFLYWLLILGIILWGTAACTIPRVNGQAGDIGAVDEFVPPAEPAAVQTNTTISLQPATQQLELDRTTTVEIRIDNISNLFGVEIQLQFDPAILRVEDVDPGREGTQIQPGNFPAPEFVQNNSVDNNAGAIFYTVVQLAPTPPASGNGTVAIVTFRALAQGSSQITFAQLKLSNQDGQPLPAVAQTGQITVGQPGDQPTPTFTPTLLPGQPTAMPTATLIPTQIPEPTSPPPTFTPIPPPPPPTLTPAPPTPPPPTPLPPMANVPPGSTIGFCYRVELGENIHIIAQKFATSPEAINLANDLYPPYHVLAHQALFIPEQMGRGPNVYIFRSGDTLNSIAERCKLPVSMILKANYLEPGAVLQPGHALIIPIPPFPPPSRFQYPTGPLPIVKFPPPCCDARPPYQPGPPLYGGK